MYIESDDLLSRYSLQLKDDKEAYEFIRKVFPRIDVLPIKGSYFSFSLQFLCQLCYVVSLPEIGSSLGSLFSGNASRMKISRQVERGVIKTLDFVGGDMGSDKGYVLTPSGADTLLSLLPYGSFEKQKMRRSGGKVPGHDYGIGLSLLKCMLLGVPFEYQKEVCFTYGAHKAKGTLCTDAVIDYKGSSPFRVFLEQDMGTESMQVLINKIADYHTLSLTRSPNLLVISSHALIDDSRYPAYALGSLRDILSIMDRGQISTLAELYEKEGESLTANRLLTLKALLVKTGCAYAIDGVTKKRIFADRVNHASIIKLTGDVDFTRDDLSRYIAELVSHTNPYRIRDYNRQQSRDTKNKYRGICSKLNGVMMRGDYAAPYIRPFLEGFQTLVCPSVFLADTLMFLSPLHKELPHKLYEYLKEYYPSIDALSYAPLSEPVRLHKDYPSICLRNCFSFGSDSYICVEHIGRDIGGFVRASYLSILSNLDLLEGKTIHVIALCDAVSDIKFYSSLFSYYKMVRKIPQSGFFLSFLLESDFIAGDRLKMASSADGEHVEYYTIPTPSQREEELRAYSGTPKNPVAASDTRTLAELLSGK